MPDKPLTVATYAAGASLAAITLVYVFGPTFFLDDRSTATRKQGVVGLSNPANDCFINSVLQALAGAGDLRVYLIQELHRREEDKQGTYTVSADTTGSAYPPTQRRKAQSLLDAIVTQALKDMLDRLNERPLFAKTISAAPFIYSLEQAFHTRMNRQQQDAQELLHLVLERLDDEFQAGAKARQTMSGCKSLSSEEECLQSELESKDKKDAPEAETSQQPIFPFEGKTETIIECQTCHFAPKPNSSTFVTLTLNVPQVASTTLDTCFDGLTKQEYIDDYRCDRCRLAHAISIKSQALARTTQVLERKTLEGEISSLQQAIDSDPEKPPEGVSMPDMKQVPRRRISKHTHLSIYPKILAVHLSRSIFDPGSYSQKNTSKVSFTEQLVLGGLSDHCLESGSGRETYRLIAVVTHHGGHNSGHYETFRRQVMSTPGLWPKSLERGGLNSRSADTPLCTMTASPASGAEQDPSLSEPHYPAREHLSNASEQIQLVDKTSKRGPTVASPRSSVTLAKERVEERKGGQRDRARRKMKKKEVDRWWRMSDEKVKECRTSAVLSMQRDVYLLFYELES